jgi:hypothetical protein
MHPVCGQTRILRFDSVVTRLTTPRYTKCRAICKLGQPRAIEPVVRHSRFVYSASVAESKNQVDCELALFKRMS